MRKEELALWRVAPLDLAEEELQRCIGEAQENRAVRFPCI